MFVVDVGKLGFGPMSIIKDVERDRNILKFKCNTSIDNDKQMKMSPKFTLEGFTVFRVKVKSDRTDHVVTPAQPSVFGTLPKNPLSYRCLIYIEFIKTVQNDPQTYTLTVSSQKLNIEDVTFLSDDTTWREIGQIQNCTKIDFDITMEVGMQSHNSQFKYLYNDTKLTDLELCGVSGSIKVHALVAAAFISEFKRKLFSEEKLEGKIETRASNETLEHLRSYMYLQELPKDGIKQLAELASLYNMTDLMTKCSFKLLYELTDENTLALLDFAHKNKLHKLKLGILKNVAMGSINVDNLNEPIPDIKDL